MGLLELQNILTDNTHISFLAKRVDMMYSTITYCSAGNVKALFNVEMSTYQT